MLQNHRVGYPDTTWGSLHVSQYYHDNVDKNFYNYVKTIWGENLTHFPRSMYIYKKKHNQTIQKGDVYLPDFYYYDIGHHVADFVFTLPKSNHL